MVKGMIMAHNIFSPVEDLVEEARAGRMIVLVDSPDRENEGDLVIPAVHARPDIINFMVTHGRGLVCLTLTQERQKILGLPMMTSDNKTRYQTAFTCSVEAASGVTTGISAYDRAHTIATAIDPQKTKDALVSPGHVFPVIAKSGGVCERPGHTEASVDLARLAGLNPAGVICEILNEDGRMARLPDLIPFCREHALKLGSIADIIAYRKHRQVQDVPAEEKIVA